MKVGWRLVAKLGDQDPHFPHVLADPFGWAVRLGSNRHADIKYFSTLPSLLEGLVEHAVRRNLGTDHPIFTPIALAEEVRRELALARELCRSALHHVDFIARISRREAI